MNENLKDESKKNINPFFEDYNTPHETVPFNLIQTQHYEEAFIEGTKPNVGKGIPLLDCYGFSCSI